MFFFSSLSYYFRASPSWTDAQGIIYWQKRTIFEAHQESGMLRQDGVDSRMFQGLAGTTRILGMEGRKEGMK